MPQVSGVVSLNVLLVYRIVALISFGFTILYQAGYIVATDFLYSFILSRDCGDLDFPVPLSIG